MEKRTILAIILCLAIWLVWQALFIKKPDEVKPPEEPGKNEAAIQTAQETDATNSEKENIPKEEDRPGEKIAVLETEQYRAEFTTRGAALKSLILKDYKARDDRKGLLSIEEDLISSKGENALPLRIGFRQEGNALAIPKYNDWEILEQGDEKTVFKLVSTGGSNIEIRKSFKKRAEPYQIEMGISITNGEQGSLDEQLCIETHGEHRAMVSTGCFSPPSAPRTAVCLVSGNLLRTEDKPGQQSGQPDVMWSGIDDQYFLLAVVPVATEKAACSVESTGQLVSSVLIMPETSISPGGTAEHSFVLYMGPKRVELLSDVKGGAGNQEEKAHLDKAVDFGWLGILCHPMLWALKIFYSWTKNYGIAIIILTIIIKILLQPLTNKSMKSMREMAKLKPLMDELKAKYKDNKEKLNQEMMNLYKVHKINPLGGCFPMLLQMPIWIALYRMLYSAVELYQAPFIVGWINDLSWRDPFYIMPIVLGLAMFIQQKLSPSPADSQQAKIMLYAMPIFFTFIMLYLPAGLVLYILVNSMLSIGQQFVFNRKSRQNPASAKA